MQLIDLLTYRCFQENEAQEYELVAPTRRVYGFEPFYELGVWNIAVG